MCAKANTQTAIPEQKQGGCCCESAVDAPKSTADEIRKPAVAEGQGASVKESAGVRSKGCCGGH